MKRYYIYVIIICLFTFFIEKTQNQESKTMFAALLITLFFILKELIKLNDKKL